MEIFSLIVQQLHAGVISLLPFAPIWLILLYLVTYAHSDVKVTQTIAKLKNMHDIIRRDSNQVITG